jgi:hypothetical protein
MAHVMVRNQEIELTIAQIIDAIRQLKPEERNMVRRALDDRAWSERTNELLARVWSKVQDAPLTEAEVNAEVETVRQSLYAARRH